MIPEQKWSTRQPWERESPDNQGWFWVYGPSKRRPLLDIVRVDRYYVWSHIDANPVLHRDFDTRDVLWQRAVAPLIPGQTEQEVRWLYP